MTPNTYAPAAQFSWLLQLTAALTLTVAMVALAFRLRRPALRALAAAWVVHSVIAFDNLLFYKFRAVKDAWPAIVNFGLPWALGGALAAFYTFAARSVAGIERDVRLPTRAVVRWVLTLTLVGLLIELAVSRLWPSNVRAEMVTSRLAYGVAYLIIATVTARAMRSSPERRAWIWPLFAASAFRVLQIGLDLGLRLKSVETALSVGEATAVVTLQLLALILLGLASASVGLEQERSVVLDQERRLHAAQLSASHSERLESLGRLAGGVAHDFNNLLTVILASADDALRRHPDDEDLHAIADAAERGSSLTRQLTSFARGKPAVPTRMELGGAVRALEPLLRRLLGETATMRLELAEAPDVLMDATQFQQMLMNLTVNARDAMQGVGTLTVRLDCQTLTVPTPILGGSLAPGRYARFSVTDTGPGMSAEVIARAFEPFYTTKGPSGGSGLGLATVFSAARGAGGDVTVTSAPGEGARFEILVPAAGGSTL